jgi:hypothetical protein
MSPFCRIVLGILALSLGLLAQNTFPHWANANEYHLGSRALMEPDAAQQLVLLREWEAQYPNTEMERERRMAFAISFQKAGNFNEAFARASELLKLDGNDPRSLMLVISLGPKLTAPSASQINLVKASALKLRSVKLTPPDQVGSDAAPPPSPADPDSQQVLEFIRERRRGHTAINANADGVKNRLIEAALTWAKELER